MDKKTKIKTIRFAFKTFKREFVEYYLDHKIPDWRELEPEWQSIFQLPPGDPERWARDEEPKDIAKYFNKWRKLPQERIESQDEEKYNIEVLPTLVVINNGVEISRFSGNLLFQLNVKKKEVQAKIDSIIISKFE